MKIAGSDRPPIPVATRDPLKPMSGSVAGRENERLWKAAKGIESLFMGELLKAMQKGLPENSMTKKGMSDLLFTQVMGKAMAEGGGIGMADLLYENLLPAAGSDSTTGTARPSLQNMILPPKENNKNDPTSSK